MVTIVSSIMLAFSSLIPAEPTNLVPTVEDAGKSIVKLAKQQLVIKPKPPELFSYATASYYTLGGTGACGTPVQSGYRFASLILRCGQVIKICHNSCVSATMSDHGPYVSGRTFDLNANLKAAIGCPDLCTVKWHTIN